MRTSTIILLSIACIAIFSSIANAATFKFESSKVAPDILTQIRITTTKDENINGMSFTSTLTTDEAADVENKTFELQMSGVNSEVVGVKIDDFGSSGSCWDVKTGQLFSATSSIASKSITITPNAKSTFGEVFKKGDYGAHEILCAISISKPESFTKFTKNMVVSWLDDDAPQTSTIQVEPPSFDEPLINITNAEYTLGVVKGESSQYGTMKVTFKVDRIGVYKLSMTNALHFDSKYASTKDTEWFCNGVKTQRITYTNGLNANVYITEVPSNDIQCTLAISESYYNKDIDTKLQIELGEYKGTYDIKFERAKVDAVTVFSTGVSKAAKNKLELDITVATPRDVKTSTALTADSTIVFQFSTHVPMSKFAISDSRCIGASSIARFENTVTISTFVKDKDGLYPEFIQCQFQFSSFDYTTFKGAFVTVEVNDKSIKSYQFNSSKGYFYVFANPDIDAKDDTTFKIDGNNIVATDKFEIKHDDDWAVPIEEAHLALYVRKAEQLVMSYEDFTKHVKCNWANADKTEIDFKYDDDTMTWVASKVGTIGDNKSEYNVQFTCTRTYPNVSKFGLNVAFAPKMEAAIITLWKGKNVVIEKSDTTTDNESDFEQPTSRPQGAEIPKKAQYKAVMSVTGTYQKDKEYTFSTFSNIAKDWKSVANTLLNKGIDGIYTSSVNDNENSYSFDFATAGINYVDFEITPKKKDFYEKELKVKGGEGLEFGFVQNEANWRGDADGLLRPNFHASQSYTLTPKTDGEYPAVKSFAIDAFTQNWSKKSNEFVSNNLGATVFSGTTVQTKWVTPTESCGYSKGAYITVGNKDEDFQNWEMMRLWTVQVVPCNIGESCEYNADCQAPVSDGIAICRDKKCTFKARVAPMYKYANSSTMISFVFTFVFVAIALLF